MKRFFSLTIFIVLIVVSLTVLYSCTQSERVPDGTYSGIAGDCGEKYIFDGKRVRMVSYLLGNVAFDYSGTYTLSGDEITFRFPEDEDGLYSRTLKFALSEDGKSITIDGDVFRLVSSDDATTSGEPTEPASSY